MADDRSPTLTDRNRQLILGLYEVANEGDLDAMQSLYAPGYRVTLAAGHPVPGSWTGPEATEAVQRLFKACGIRSITVHEVVADGPHRVIGLVDANGIDAAGQPWTMPVTECFWVEDAKITDIRPFYWDLVELRRIAGMSN